MPADEAVSTDRLKELLVQIDPVVLQQVMPLTGGVLTMMFTDIVNSTRINAAMGDIAYFQARELHNDIVRKCVDRFNGRPIKTIGDSYFLGFAVPANAVACAVEVQQRLSEAPIRVGEEMLQIRIGLHTGSPIVHREDVSKLIDLAGNDVNKTARVEALGGQTKCSFPKKPGRWPNRKTPMTGAFGN